MLGEKFRDFLNNLEAEDLDELYDKLRWHIAQSNYTLAPREDRFFENIFQAVSIEELLDHSKLVEERAYFWKLFQEVLTNTRGLDLSFEVFQAYMDTLKNYFKRLLEG